MTLELILPPQLEDRLRREAERRGVAPAAVTLQLLEEHLPPSDADRRAAAIAMLEQWEIEDAALTPEQEAENAAVLRAIDEDRLSDRKWFTEVLKDSPS